MIFFNTDGWTDTQTIYKTNHPTSLYRYGWNFFIPHFFYLSQNWQSHSMILSLTIVAVLSGCFLAHWTLGRVIRLLALLFNDIRGRLWFFQGQDGRDVLLGLEHVHGDHFDVGKWGALEDRQLRGGGVVGRGVAVPAMERWLALTMELLNGWRLAAIHIGPSGKLNYKLTAHYLGEVSLIGWPPVWLVWIQLRCSIKIISRLLSRLNTNKHSRRSDILP